MNISKQTKWDKRFLQLSEYISTWSKDPSSKVGAVIALDKRIISHGYNGFPQGVPDANDFLNDREQKYPRIIHAEQNAILFAQRDLTNHTLYCTHYPCTSCAGIIIQSGVLRVVCYRPTDEFYNRWKTMIDISDDMFKRVGIIVIQYEKENENGGSNVSTRQKMASGK